MGELAAAVAHELNQPLMAAGTYTRLVDDAMRSGNPDMRLTAETAKKAVAQVERAAEVVRQLRALVRLDRSSRAPCRLTRIAEEAIEPCRPDLERVHVTVESKIAADLPPVMADLLQIEQVLINLVRNAIEAMPDGGVVTIESGMRDGNAVMRVHDTGPGLPEGVDVFQLFVTTKAKGTGLGLSIAQQIVLEHGGELVGSSEPGQGATFTMTLPIKPAEGRAEEMRP
jgi:signal transduction histidine kinase